MLCKPEFWFIQVVGWPQGAAKTPASPCSLRRAQVSQVCPLPASCPLSPQAAGAASETEVAWAVCKPCSAVTAALGVFQHWFCHQLETQAAAEKKINSLPAKPSRTSDCPKESCSEVSSSSSLQKKEYLLALGTSRNFFTEKQLQSLQHALGAGQSLQYCPEVGK